MPQDPFDRAAMPLGQRDRQLVIRRHQAQDLDRVAILKHLAARQIQRPARDRRAPVAPRKQHVRDRQRRRGLFEPDHPAQPPVD
jgi:hypothetical protein